MMSNAGADRNEPSPEDRPVDKRYLLAAHIDAAYNLASWLLRDKTDAQDAVQEAYVRALRHFDGLRGDDCRSWLLSIVRNSCFDRIQRRTGDLSFDDRPDSISDESPNPEVSLLNKERTQQLENALQALPPQMREVLVLREFEDMSYKDIASVIGLPVGTVMSRLSRAREGLRRIAVSRLANRSSA